MDIRDEWIAALRHWAENNGSVLELWIFGSRAKLTAHKDSDIDIAVLLMPPDGKHNWALANWVEFFDQWKAELKSALDWPVSLTAIGKGFEMDDEVRSTGVRIWRRGISPQANRIARP